MRAIGERALDIVIEHYETGRDAPVTRAITRLEAERLLRTPLPEQPTPVNDLFEILRRDVFPYGFRSDHPRFYAFVPGPSNFVSVIGDLLTSGENIFAGHWMASAGAAQIELIVLDWLKELIGYPTGASGILVSGGSMANLSAIAVAREVRLGGPDDRAVIYYSDQTHSSVGKGIRMLGFRAEQRRTVATDDTLRLSIAALEAAIRDDRAAGRRPFCVVANAGTTNTGAVDPLGPLADLCEREGMWLHVDGAYGAAAAITDRGRAALHGIERADSVTIDPHKWLFQPFELGCLLVRDPTAQPRAFRIGDEDHPDYLVDVARHVRHDVNFYEHGIQLTRSFKALKLWLSMRAFGVAEFRRGVNVGLDMAEFAERTLRADGRWTIVTPATLGVVTFRWHDRTKSDAELDAITSRTVDLTREDGFALVMSTTLQGRPALRLCPIHPATTEADLRETIARLARFSVAAAG